MPPSADQLPGCAACGLQANHSGAAHLHTEDELAVGQQPSHIDASLRPLVRLLRGGRCVLGQEGQDAALVAVTRGGMHCAASLTRARPSALVIISLKLSSLSPPAVGARHDSLQVTGGGRRQGRVPNAKARQGAH